MNFMYKFERKFGRFAIPNLTLILICCYVAGYIIQTFNAGFLNYFTLDTYQILHGQIWRLITWLLIPPNNGNIFFTLIMLVFYYSIGTTLERTWGVFQYNLYLLSGVLFTILGSFLMMGYVYLFQTDLLASYTDASIFSAISASVSTYYVNMSIFLAFAATFPENEILLMFIIPIKVKWLGIVYFGFLVYQMLNGMFNVVDVGFVYPFVIGSSLLNFILFFLTTRNYIRMNKSQRKMHKAFKEHVKKQQKFQNMGVNKHKCDVCGRSEKDDPTLTFRFCSKCEGNFEYCQDHLYTHIHFTKNGPSGPLS